VEAGTGLEHEKGNRLLKEQSDHDGAPLDMRPVLRSRPETKLKHDKTSDGNRAIAIFRTLVRPTPINGWIHVRYEASTFDNKKLSKKLTFSRLEPNAEPRTIARRANQPKP
jgi:hypothetical protein